MPSDPRERIDIIDGIGNVIATFPEYVDPDIIPIEYGPPDWVPLSLLEIWPEKHQPAPCRVTKCPWGTQGCIDQGYCEIEYDIWWHHPYVWWGDYA